MTDEIIMNAQDYLTVNNGGQIRQIINIELLIRRHGPDQVIEFLRKLSKQYKRELKRRILKDKTDSRINELIAKLFRITMAINTIRNGKGELAA